METPTLFTEIVDFIFTKTIHKVTRAQKITEYGVQLIFEVESFILPSICTPDSTLFEITLPINEPVLQSSE